LIKIHVGPRSRPSSRTQLAGLFPRLLAKPSDSNNEVVETVMRQDPSVLDIAEVADALAVDLGSGLSPAEAARRLAVDGPNELRAVPPVPTWRKIFA